MKNASPFGHGEAILCDRRAALRKARQQSVKTPPRGALALRSVGGFVPSHFEQSLTPALPGLPVGVSRRFWAMACVSRSRLT